MRRADRWLALVRIVVGFWFAKGLATKLSWTLVGGILPFPSVSQRWINFLPERLAEWVASGPPGWYESFLVNAAIPNSTAFAKVTAWGEILVGIGLMLGLFTVLASLGGLWLILNYFVAAMGSGFNQQGFHVLLIACFVAFIAARAGRTWGLDGWLLRHRPRSRLVRFFS